MSFMRPENQIFQRRGRKLKSNEVPAVRSKIGSDDIVVGRGQYSLTRSLSFTHIRSLHSFIHSFIHQLAHSFLHSFIHKFIHSLMHPFQFDTINLTYLKGLEKGVCTARSQAFGCNRVGYIVKIIRCQFSVELHFECW